MGIQITRAAPKSHVWAAGSTREIKTIQAIKIEAEISLRRFFPRYRYFHCALSFSMCEEKWSERSAVIEVGA